MFSEKDAQSEGLQGLFSEKDAQSEGLQGLFSKFDAHSEGLQGMFGKKTYFQRLFWGRLFPKSPFRALFLGGFSSKTAFPCAWKCCFRWEHVARLDVKNGEAHRDLFFLCGLFQSFASQLFSHVACFHIHVIDVFFAIVAA